MEDSTKIHMLSEKGLLVTPDYIIEMQQRFKDLEAQLKADIEFGETLIEKGLYETYLKSKYGKL